MFVRFDVVVSIGFLVNPKNFQGHEYYHLWKTPKRVALFLLFFIGLSKN